VSRSFELPEADWATVGAVGPPGGRTFFLQARQDNQLVTLKLEKQQVAALAHFLAEILADLPARGPGPAPPSDLVEPALAEWAVGGLALSYDAPADRLVILAQEIGLAEEVRIEPDDPFDPAANDPAGDPAANDPAGDPAADPGSSDLGVARIGITPATAAAIVRRGEELLQAGRPACGLCGRPMNPEGHSCPRTNGHRPN
jgi:uncharacterized repeat protein (TIGR03847 family)